jgi:hypothetical protein
MLGKTKTAFFAFCLCGLFLVIYVSWNQARRSNLLSCVYTVGDNIVEYSDIAKFVRDDENWYVLSEKEAAGLLESYADFDCPAGLGELPPDIRERKYAMAVRKTGRSQYEVRVWSNGFDDIAGTDDDIVFPKGDKALK